MTSKIGKKGQATTEVVLLLPMFMFFLFAFVKIFALLMLVQKMEIASFYAARRWQLESHRNVDYTGYDQGALLHDIQDKVRDYIGYGQPAGKFLDLVGNGTNILTVAPTQVWQVVTLTVRVNPVKLPYYQSKGFKFETTKYVPNRDRPIAFILPGMQEK